MLINFNDPVLQQEQENSHTLAALKYYSYYNNTPIAAITNTSKKQENDFFPLLT